MGNIENFSSRDLPLKDLNGKKMRLGANYKGVWGIGVVC